MIKPVVLYGDKNLETPCESCAGFYEQYTNIGRDLVDTVSAHAGVGLAANQIGIGLRLMAIQQHGNRKGYLVVRNPVVSVDGPRVMDYEACLSLPGLRLPVLRHTTAMLSGTTTTGEIVPPTMLRGVDARILQHEMDHLDGITILARTNRHARRAALVQWRKKAPTAAETNNYAKHILEANSRLAGAEAPLVVMPNTG